MKLHEYQSKKILASYGISVPESRLANTPSQAATAGFDLGGPIVVKAQVHAGGRGKAGGVKVVNTPGAAETVANSLLGKHLVTQQTGEEGVLVEKLLIEEVIDIVKEFYLSIVVDGSTKGPVLIASKAGGMDIETVAKDTPDEILQIAIDPVSGLQPFQGRKIGYSLGLENSQIREFSSLVQNLYKAFINTDASLIEINPLVTRSDGSILAADAKIEVDDDAIFRHPEIRELEDQAQQDPLEIEAREFDINYVKLDGNIGCIVNGAGLAMATMDVISNAGAKPANFLDIGGGADEEKVAKALGIVLSDQAVKAVLVNLFGGILRCDIAARGFILASERAKHIPPMVVRMLGTNSEQGRDILSKSDLDIQLVGTLDEAAESIERIS
jgi:succinyl-CoA synthetase beta subunit